MTLISLLLVLALERVTHRNGMWQSESYTGPYFNWALARFSSPVQFVALIGVVFVPVLVMLAIQQSTSGFWMFVLATAILMICVGCPKQRSHYKGYLQAANRGDLQACSLFADEMGHNQDAYTFGQTLVWVNYQHYASVVLWFAALGPAGALMYVLVRALDMRLATDGEAHSGVRKLLHVLDWLPVRVTALGFLLVGHFSRALPVWLAHLLDVTQSPREFLARVAKAAEEVEPDEDDCTEEPCTMVRLAKRNLVFLLVVISLLTLGGFID